MVSYDEYRKQYLSNPRRRLNAIYNSIKSRCNKPTNSSYYRYWGKGTKCLWTSLDEFCDDMMDSYILHRDSHIKNGKHDTTLDRIDTLWHYCKENCRRVTMKEQNNNRGNNKVIDWKTIAQRSDESGISQWVIWARMNRNWWTLEEVLSVWPKPVGWNRNHK